MRIRGIIIFLFFAFYTLINFISCKEKEKVIFCFSVDYDHDTIQVLNSQNEILLDTIITTNYSTGLACNYLLNKDQFTNKFKISVNGKLHDIQEPINEIRIDIYYLNRIIKHEQSSGIRYYASNIPVEKVKRYKWISI